MDLSWAEQHLARDDPDMKQRLHRVQQSLSAGVRSEAGGSSRNCADAAGQRGIVRRALAIEKRPAQRRLECTEVYPDEEPKFTSEAAIALFALRRDAFTNILSMRRRVRGLTLD